MLKQATRKPKPIPWDAFDRRRFPQAAIDLALVEDGIEIGKKMMAEMIATYDRPSSTVAKHSLNEVSPLTAGEHPQG